MNVDLTLTTHDGAIVVPTQAVQTGQDGQFVFVVKPDQTVESRPVTPGDLWQGLTVIDKGDLRAGDKVVTDGQLRLVDGTKIVIKNAPQSQPAPKPLAAVVASSPSRAWRRTGAEGLSNGVGWAHQ